MSSTSNDSEVTDSDDDNSKHDSELETMNVVSTSGIDDDEKLEQDESSKLESDNMVLNDDLNKSSHQAENDVNDDSTVYEEEMLSQEDKEEKVMKKKDSRIELTRNDVKTPVLSSDSNTEPNSLGSKPEQYCGVLSKRRDVFKNQWRDRYFILNNENGELSYYLIPKKNRRGNNKRQNRNKKWNDTSNDNNEDQTDNADNQNQEEINETLDVDINLEPRGVIYLSANTSVRILNNDELFRNNRQRKRQNEQNQMFGFAITTPPLRKKETTKNRKQRTRQGRMQKPNIDVSVDTNDLNDSVLTNIHNHDNISKVNQNNDMNNNGSVTYLSAHSEVDRNIWVQHITAACASMKLKASSTSYDDNDNNESYNENTKSKWDQLPPPLDWSLKNTDNELFENVPDSITHKILEMMNASISILSHNIQTDNSSLSSDSKSEDANITTSYTQQSWEPLWQKKGIIAVKKQQDNAFMVKCEKVLNHDIKDIFHLLWDIRQKPRYESNITSAKRLLTYNPHTYLDYYVSLPLNESQKVKEFCLLSHWRILKDGDGTSDSMQMSQNSTNQKLPSLLFFSFSHDSHLCPENESKFSRANLILSAWLLEEYHPKNMSDLMESSTYSASADNKKSCRVRFVSSMDLHDEDLSSVTFDNVIDQHALLPSSIEDYLDFCQTQKGSINTIFTEMINTNVFDMNNEEIKVKKLTERVASFGSISDFKTVEMVNLNTIAENMTKTDSNVHIPLENSNGTTDDTEQMLSSKPYSRENISSSHSSSFYDDKSLSSDPKNIESSSVSNKSKFENSTTKETEEGNSEIDEVTSVSINAITSSHMMNALVFLSCSTSWLFARFSPIFYPYRGFIFTFFFSTCFLIQTGIAKTASSYIKQFLIGRKDALPQPVVKQEATHLPQSSSFSEKNNSLLFSIVLFTIPSFSWYMATTLYPSHKEIIFMITFYFSLYFMVRSMLGDKITYPDGTAVGYDDVDGHIGLGTEKFSSRFVVDLKGVLRFIGNKREENKEAHLQNIQNNSNPNSVSDSEVAVSHIVVKAIAMAMSEMSIFNTTRINIPLLGIQGCYQRKRIDVSVVTGIHRLSKGANHALLLKDVSKLSIRGIANELSIKSNSLLANKTEKDKSENNALHLIIQFISFLISCFIGKKAMRTIKGTEKFGSCVVLTSPNTENSDVDVEVSPSSALGVNMVVVVGGVRVMRDTRGGSIRPALSMSLTINCPPANIASCRKFAERVQQLVQFPEICE